MTAALTYAVLGAALLAAVILPMALRRVALSAPMVLVLGGFLLGRLPWFERVRVDPAAYPELTLHATELCVLIALMGVGLALDRPLDVRSLRSWRQWRATWRLLGIAMPACIAVVALLAHGVAGLPAASALLVGAALAPTDPVLAGDVQVEGPTTEVEEEVDERDEVRFALTSEAGLNDALAFPFVVAAATMLEGPWQGWVAGWALESFVVKVALAVAIGAAGGRLLGWLAFRPQRESLQLAARGEPLLAVAAVLLVYGLTELVHGWGFLAVFVAAITLRTVERHDHYHALMHEMIERLELLMTMLLLLLLGMALGGGLLDALTWPGAAVGLLLLLVVRPVTAWLALGHESDHDLEDDGRLGPRERRVTAFFGVRGIGSVYYLAWAAVHGHFPAMDAVWSVVGFTILASVVIHGIAATPAMRWLDDVRIPQARLRERLRRARSRGGRRSAARRTS